jgi:hypothetical protein
MGRASFIMNLFHVVRVNGQFHLEVMKGVREAE